MISPCQFHYGSFVVTFGFKVTKILDLVDAVLSSQLCWDLSTDNSAVMKSRSDGNQFFWALWLKYVCKVAYILLHCRHKDIMSKYNKFKRKSTVWLVGWWTAMPLLVFQVGLKHGLNVFHSRFDVSGWTSIRTRSGRRDWHPIRRRRRCRRETSTRRGSSLSSGSVPTQQSFERSCRRI